MSIQFDDEKRKDGSTMEGFVGALYYANTHFVALLFFSNS